MYKVILRKKVINFLNKHPDLKPKFELIIDHISANGMTHKDIIKLKGDKHRYRMRIGKYRFLIKHEKNTVLIYFMVRIREEMFINFYKQ